jgi:hypothetical protein
MEDIKVYIHYVARIIEAIGVITLVVGTAIALVKYLFTIQGQRPRSYKILRQEPGRQYCLDSKYLLQET